MPATPDTFRLYQNPLGAYHLPQALTSVDPVHHWMGLSLVQVRLRFPRPESRFPTKPLFVLTETQDFEVSLVALL